MTDSWRVPARRGGIAVLALILGLALAGCVGGDDPDEVGSGASQSSVTDLTTSADAEGDEPGDGQGTVGEAIGGDEDGPTSTGEPTSGSGEDRWKIVPPPGAPGQPAG